MHNVLLTTQVPATRHTQLLHVLSGLAAHKPVPLCELHIVCRPGGARSDGRSVGSGNRETIRQSGTSLRGGEQAVGATQDIASQKNRKMEAGAGEAKFVRVVASVVPRSLADTEHDESGVDMSGEKIDETGNEGSDTRSGVRSLVWELRQDETPDAVKRPVIARVSERNQIHLERSTKAQNGATAHDKDENMTNDDNDAEAEDAVATNVAKELEDWLEQRGYIPVASYFMLGHRWTYHPHINLRLFRLCLPTPDSVPAAPISAAQIALLPTLISSSGTLLTVPETIKLVDSSGSYILEASAFIQDADRKPNLMQEGIKELVALRERLKGCVDLHALERLPAMDVRVR